MKKITTILAKNILATVIYYDVLDYPLTAFEIWKYLVAADYHSNEKKLQHFSLTDIVRELGSGKLNAYLEGVHGFYCLKGRSDLIEKRIKNGKISNNKISRLRLTVFFLRFVPFVRMVGITGRLAMKNARPQSDWDVLVVLKQGKIWTGRTLVTLFLHLIGKRRHGRQVTDRICLNYFITDASLEVVTKDLFSANEYCFLFPLFGWEIYNRFQIKNQWIRSMKPTYALCEVPPLQMFKKSTTSRLVQFLGEKIFGFTFLEQFLKKIEKGIIMRNPKTKQEGSLIHAYDDALIFLPNPHGPDVFERFKQRIEEIAG